MDLILDKPRIPAPRHRSKCSRRSNCDCKRKRPRPPLALFNKDGTPAVSTNRIAEAPGNSHGNLHLYFRNQDEIIGELSEPSATANDIAFALPADTRPTLSDLQGMAKAICRTPWQTRFAHRELMAHPQTDAQLRGRILANRRHGLESFKELSNALVAAGILRVPANDDAVSNPAELIWIFTAFCLNSLEIGGQTVDESQMERGVQSMPLIVGPGIKS